MGNPQSQSFRVLLQVNTGSDKKMTEAQVKRIFTNLHKMVEEVGEVIVHDCDEIKAKPGTKLFYEEKRP